MILLIKHRCLIPDCPFYTNPAVCHRNEFLMHASKIPSEKIIDVLSEIQVVKYPQILNRKTLLNLFADLSAEPIASQLLDESRHKKEDF